MLVIRLNNMTLRWNRLEKRWVSQSGIRFTDAEVAEWKWIA